MPRRPDPADRAERTVREAQARGGGSGRGGTMPTHASAGAHAARAAGTTVLMDTAITGGGAAARQQGAHHLHGVAA